MSRERIKELLVRFRRDVEAFEGVAAAGWNHSPVVGLELLESMLLTRHLDAAAHDLRHDEVGHYTICSSGHEANAVFGRLTRTTDPALVHYRSAAFQIERSRQRPEINPVQDIAYSLVASTLDPTSGGRHKVFGSKPLGIMPQTSTIASHLPRAVGAAFAVDRAARLGLEAETPADAVVLASFGDASLNHSTAIGALNAASWVAFQRLPLPLVLLCEDNGLGISVRTPTGWVETRARALPAIEYFSAAATDLDEVMAKATAALEVCRRERRPVFFHLRCERLLGHAGSDVDESYRRLREISSAMDRDPVRRAALALIAAGVTTAAEVLEIDERCAARVRKAAATAARAPRITSREVVMESIARPLRRAEAAVESTPSHAAADGGKRLTLGEGINHALHEMLAAEPGAIVFGEDVARKGGVYGVTRRLLRDFGALRVFNTLLDEQTILGLALGSAGAGLLPIPEIQYLAYLHNAEDQLRGEAATLPFFSGGQYDNPMVVRVASYAYQKGFGGHFHNDNSIAVLRDVPGLVLITPARADDAIELYRAALELARRERRVVVVLEPIALYTEKDLHQEGDGEWLAPVPGGAAPALRARTYGSGRDLTIATYGNGVRMSLRALAKLESEHRILGRVVDLRWLKPLPLEDLVESARITGNRLLFVDECRRTGSLSEQVATELREQVPHLRFARVTSADSFVPLGGASRLVLVSEHEIVEAARQL